MVITRTIRVNIQKLSTYCIIVSYTDLRTNSNYVPIEKGMVFVTEMVCRIISSTNFNAQFSLFINNMFVTLLSSTRYEH